MSVLQLSLLILALVAIGLVAWVSHRRNAGPRPRRAPKLDADKSAEEQLDLLGEEGAAPRFDEYGVSEPRPSGFADQPPAEQAPESPQDAAPADNIISLFVVQREGKPIPGADIHRTLHNLGLDAGERLTYERRVGGETWFHVANMRKPGHLDPAEADRFSTPGLSLFQLVSALQEPAAALDDLLATADRLAQAFDGVVLDAQRQPLTADAADALRAEIRRDA